MIEIIIPSQHLEMFESEVEVKDLEGLIISKKKHRENTIVTINVEPVSAKAVWFDLIQDELRLV